MKIFYSIVLLFFSVALLATENLACPLDANGKLLRWKSSNNAKITTLEGKTNILIDGPGKTSIWIPLKPEWKYLVLSASMRTENLVLGEKEWMNGRMVMCFYQNKERLKPWPNVFGFSGTTPTRECFRIYQVPEGATILNLSPSNLGKSGLVEFSNISLVPYTETEFQAINKDAPPPAGTTEASLWTLDDATRETNSYRESICLNGLWQAAPVDDATLPAPGSGWGWFKVPGIWPKGVRSVQQFRMSPFAPAIDRATLNTVWYRRVFQTPDNWQGRRIELEITMLQTYAKVFVDGQPAGEYRFPGGKLDLTGKLIPGKTQELTLRVSALEDETARLVHMATGRLVKSRDIFVNRGITGDMFLRSYPETGHVTDAHIITTLSAKKLAIDAGLKALKPGKYFLEAEIRDGNHTEITLKSEVFTVDSPDFHRRVCFETNWVAPKLWDTDTPQNLYYADVRLKSTSGEIIDQLYPQEFGYREFKIEGKNFLLNGTPIRLRTLPNNTVNRPAEMAFAPRQKNLVERIKNAGFNHLIAQDYRFTNCTVGYIDAFFQEASRAGVLVSLTMPHIKNFNFKLDDPAEAERYRSYAEWQIRRFQNLPGVVFYAMNHNAAGFHGDQNPQKVDGIYAPDKFMEQAGSRLAEIRRQALLAEDIVHSLDPTRVVYHHESGNLGQVITINCYLDWVPRQERSDWFEAFEKNGTKPVMLIEWGMPHVASWSSYRGPNFIHRLSGVQCLWLNEFNSAILGEEAYRLDDEKIATYRYEDQNCRGNKEILFDTFSSQWSRNEDANRVRAYMVSDNFRALRARGIACLLPWDYNLLWKKVGPGTNPPFDPLAKLKEPGIVPDVVRNWDSGMMYSFDQFESSTIGKAGLPALRPETGWIAGKAGDYTEKGHNFRPGETVCKQFLVLNDSRRERKVNCSWSVQALNLSGQAELKLAPGTRAEAPIEFTIPTGIPAGELELQAEFHFEDGSIVKDSFALQVLPKVTDLPRCVVGLYDPKGLSTPLLKELGLSTRTVRTQADLQGIQLLVIGRSGLKNFPLQLSTALRNGLKLLILEQEYSDLVRLGFRGNIYGLRNVFSVLGMKKL